MTESPMEALDGHRISMGEAAFLQLTPGALALGAYLIAAKVLTSQGLPNIFGLMIAILFVEAPVSWWLIFRRERRFGGRITFGRLFPWNRSVGLGTYLLVGIPFWFYALAVIGVVGPLFEGVLLDSVFSFVPNWFAMRPDPEMIGSLPRIVGVAMSVMMLLAMVLVGAFTPRKSPYPAG